MTCAQVRELLWEYAFDLLEPGQGKRVAEHLQDCPGCREELARLRHILASWKEVPAPTGLSERALRSAESIGVGGQAERRLAPVAAGEAKAEGGAAVPQRVVVPRWVSAARWAFAAGLLLGLLLSGAYLFFVMLAPERQDTVVIAPTRLAMPGPMTPVPSYGAMRVTVSDGTNGRPVAQATGRLELVRANQEAPFYDLCSFVTDAAGRAETRFLLPGRLIPEGQGRSDLFQVRVEASTSYGAGEGVGGIGHDRFALPILLERTYRLLLETDAGAYRPGETVRVRGLVADEVMLQPQPYVGVQLELHDSRGRTVASTRIRGTKWALFSGELPLPDDLAPGTYQLVASAGVSALEQTVDVVRAETEGGGPRPPKATESAAPGRAPGAREAGAASSAESGGQSLSKPPSPSLRVLVRPEAGVLVPGVENSVYVLVTDPDGRPASAQVTLRSADGPVLSARTDEVGLAVFSLRPGAEGFAGTLLVKGDAGTERQVDVRLAVPDPPATVLLRPERWYYRSGEPIRLTLLAPKYVSSAFLDVTQNGQLMFTRTVPLAGGATEVEFTFGKDEAPVLGLLELRAYPAEAQAILGSVSRQVCVGPAEPVQVHAEVEPPAEGATGSPSTGGPRLRLAVDRAVPSLLSVSVMVLPASEEGKPAGAGFLGSYLLGDRLTEVGHSPAERFALADLFSPGGPGVNARGLLPPARDRVCSALLGAGSRIVAGKPSDPAAALLLTRTYPKKAASVARMQERFLPLLGIGLWSTAALLAAAGVGALTRVLGSPGAGPGRRALLVQAAVAGAALGLILLAVLPQAQRPEFYREQARLAEEPSAPAVLGPAPSPRPLDAGTRPGARQEAGGEEGRGEGTARERPYLRALVWEPAVQTDAQGIALLDLPPLPAGSRLRVSVLALVPPAEGKIGASETILTVGSTSVTQEGKGVRALGREEPKSLRGITAGDKGPAPSLLGWAPGADGTRPDVARSELRGQGPG